MASLLPVFLTDTFDQWRQKENAIVDRVNNITVANDVFSLQDPINNQDILTYNTSLGKFVNTTITTLVSSIISELGSQAVSQLKPYYWASLRNIF